MIINTGNRTDIPAFYSTWFRNRLQAGEVYVRHPYHPTRVTRYQLSPDVVDCFLFCTKNPQPMLSHLDELKDYGQLWFVTMTPYGADIEPRVPKLNRVISAFKALSHKLGKERMVWRYDPILITNRYSVAHHLTVFERMAAQLEGATEVCVISFVDLYEKTLKNFSGLQAVPQGIRLMLAERLVAIAETYGMRIQTCAEGNAYAKVGVDVSGCMSQAVIERAIGATLSVPAHAPARAGCDCLLGNDIGAYHTCAHGCRYCYATTDHEQARLFQRKHDAKSPMLLGDFTPQDTHHDAKMVSYIRRQQQLFPS